jgi:hypothetical protein
MVRFAPAQRSKLLELLGLFPDQRLRAQRYNWEAAHLPATSSIGPVRVPGNACCWPQALQRIAQQSPLHQWMLSLYRGRSEDGQTPLPADCADIRHTSTSRCQKVVSQSLHPMTPIVLGSLSVFGLEWYASFPVLCCPTVKPAALKTLWGKASASLDAEPFLLR